MQHKKKNQGLKKKKNRPTKNYIQKKEKHIRGKVVIRTGGSDPISIYYCEHMYVLWSQIKLAIPSKYSTY
jgi:hypothetical protein